MIPFERKTIVFHSAMQLHNLCLRSLLLEFVMSISLIPMFFPREEDELSFCKKKKEELLPSSCFCYYGFGLLSWLHAHVPTEISFEVELLTNLTNCRYFSNIYLRGNSHPLGPDNQEKLKMRSGRDALHHLLSTSLTTLPALRINCRLETCCWDQ